MKKKLSLIIISLISLNFSTYNKTGSYNITANFYISTSYSNEYKNLTNYQNSNLSSGSYRLALNTSFSSIAFDHSNSESLIRISIHSMKDVFINIQFLNNFNTSEIPQNMIISSVLFEINSSDFDSWFLSTSTSSGIIKSSAKFVYSNSSGLFNLESSIYSDFVETTAFVGNGTYFVVGQTYIEDDLKLIQNATIVFLSAVVNIGFVALPIYFLYGYFKKER